MVVRLPKSQIQRSVYLTYQSLVFCEQNSNSCVDFANGERDQHCHGNADGLRIVLPCHNCALDNYNAICVTLIASSPNVDILGAVIWPGETTYRTFLPI